MPKFKVSGMEVISFTAEIEAEDENHARELAFEDGKLWDVGKVRWNEVDEDSIVIEEIK